MCGISRPRWSQASEVSGYTCQRSRSGFEKVLAHGLLLHSFTSFLRIRSIERARLASRWLSERLAGPRVPQDLLRAVPGHLHIKREMTLARLQSLALQHSSQAVRAIVERLGDEDEYDHLRVWTLNSLQALAEPGDAWAINAIVGPPGPLELGGTMVREQALKLLLELTIEGCPKTIRAAVSMLRFSESCKDCAPLRLQARRVVEYVTITSLQQDGVDARSLAAELGLEAEWPDSEEAAREALLGMLLRDSQVHRTEAAEEDDMVQKCSVVDQIHSPPEGGDQVSEATGGECSTRGC